MAQTTILSSITKSGSYPLSTDLTAKDHCGTMSISLTGTWTTQMIHEMPTINFGVFMQDGTKLISIDFDMSTFTSDNGGIDTVNPYTIALYDLPEEFVIKVTPIFDKYALESHNAQVEAGDVSVFDTTDKGIVDTNTSDYSALLWTTPTTTFNLVITFDDANVSSGGGGGSSSADQVVFVPPADMTSTNVQDAIVELDTKINDLPEPMIFKGSLGTGGTITTLPAASAANKGFTYKVITAGTYQGVSAKVGDTLISDGTTWVLIPSGDEPSGTVTNVAVSSTDGSMTITGSPITSSGTIGISLNPATMNTLGGVMNGSSVESLDGKMEIKQSAAGDGINISRTAPVPAAYQTCEYIAGGTNMSTGVSGQMVVTIDASFAQIGSQLIGFNLAANQYFGLDSQNRITAEWTLDDYVEGANSANRNKISCRFENGQRSLVSVLGVADTSLGYTSGIVNDYSALPAFNLFYVGSSGHTPNMTLYGATITDLNGNLIRNYIPCYVKATPTSIGLYDTVTQTFTAVTSATKGPDVSQSDSETKINVTPATTSDIGGVIVGDSLAVANDGTISFDPPIMTLQEYNNLQTKDSPIYFIYEQ